jgi:isocitrate dehydrogenase kinase/phosphatase
MIHRRHFHKVVELVATITVVIVIGIVLQRFMQINFHHDQHSTTINNCNNTKVENILQTTNSNMTFQEVIHRVLFLNHDNRIVGGVPVQDGEFPFFVHPIGIMLCGATLIHPEYV